MLYLLTVSIVWAFSFGLIKGNLTDLDPNFVSFARLAISFIIFIPFLKLAGISNNTRLRFFFTGMVQYGVMYIAYIHAFQYLPAHIIALFTIFTPIYVTLLNDLLEKRFQPHFHLAAILAVIGMAVVVYRNMDREALWIGFILMQISNLAFALGQVYYKKEMAKNPGVKDRNIFALLYLGGLAATALATILSNGWQFPVLHSHHITTLLYLGILASGACFFLWNYGATRTNVGALAVFNNVKVPLAVAISILFFHEQGDIPRLLVGGGIILLALLINQRIVKKKS